MFTGIGFKVQEEFKKIAKAVLDTKVKQLAFIEDGGRPAAAVINLWVANKTNGKIDSIISSGKHRMTRRCQAESPDLQHVDSFNCPIVPVDSLTNQTQAILVSTIHFKAPWKIPFDPEETRNAPFHLNPDEQIKVAMMTSEDRYAYGDLQDLNATAVVIPYKVGQLV